MKQRKRVLGAFIAASALFAAACSDDDKSTTPATEAPDGTDAPDATDAPDGTDAPDTTDGPVETDPPAAEGWAVDTSLCVDEAAANAPIEGTIKIGSAMPLSGGAAAAAFAPVKDGFEAYIQYANENDILGDMEIEIAIEDDQYNAELTPGAVATQLDAGDRKSVV